MKASSLIQGVAGRCLADTAIRNLACTTYSYDLGMMVGRVADAPWRMPANLEDMRAFFNYDLNPHKWREYCKRVEQYRLQYTMQVHTQ